MSLSHLKKQAKNLHRHLPVFLSESRSEISLSDCQELAAKMNGYPSFHAATKEPEIENPHRKTPVDDASTQSIPTSHVPQGMASTSAVVPFFIEVLPGTSESFSVRGWWVDVGVMIQGGKQICVAVLEGLDDKHDASLLDSDEQLRRLIIDTIRGNKWFDDSGYFMISMVICTPEHEKNHGGYAYGGVGMCEQRHMRKIPIKLMSRIMKSIRDNANVGYLSAYERYVLRRCRLHNRSGNIELNSYSEEYFNNWLIWARQSVWAFEQGRSFGINIKISGLESEFLESILDCARFDPSLRRVSGSIKLLDYTQEAEIEVDSNVSVRTIAKNKKGHILARITSAFDNMK